MFRKSECPDCGKHPAYHILSWIDAFVGWVIDAVRIPRWLDTFLDLLIERILLLTFLVEKRDDFFLSEIDARSACFIAEGRKRGISFQAVYGPTGYTGNFSAQINGKEVRFSGLPTAKHLSRHDISFTYSKERTKKHLKKGGFPIASGKTFSFYQKSQALEFGCESLGFPLVVKPQYGSLARHVTTDIRSREALKKAVDSAAKYSPTFILERFIADSAEYRATVVDFDSVAVVKRVPANVEGDGELTIKELIEKKNADREAKSSSELRPHTALSKITVDETTNRLLEERGYTFNTVPEAGETVYLQKDPLRNLGGDLVEVTEVAHPEMIQLFKNIAEFFDMRLVGIDFLTPNIENSLTDQRSAVLELNSVPCIEMHHFPSSGKPQNVASDLVDLFVSVHS